MKPRVNAALFAAGIVAVALPVGAQERPTLAGSWSASALGERWNIGDWGEACGPKPAPRGAAGGSVQIAESGGELTFSGGGYPRTSGCFEMGGPIAVSSHSASARFWRTRCSTSASDPRKATIVTTISATDTAISFDETGEYQFILKDQNCTASVRRNRTYSLVKRLGDDPPAASAVAPSPPPATATTTTPPPKPEPERATTPACDSPGEPVRVEVRPARKVMKPGETFQLKAALLDAAGCRVAQPPTWTAPDGTAITVSSAGLVTIASDASEGEYAIAAGAFGRAAKVTIEVVSPARYEKLLAAGGVADKDEAAVATVTTASLGASEAVAEDTARHRRFVFLGIVGACVAALGAAGIVLLRRQKPEVEEIEELVPGETKMKVVRKKRLVAKAPTTVRCPTCAREFPAGSVFCPNDGGRLVAASAAPAPEAPAAGAKVCPVCGVRYGANAQFCGKEGATLVPAM